MKGKKTDGKEKKKGKEEKEDRNKDGERDGEERKRKGVYQFFLLFLELLFQTPF